LFLVLTGGAAYAANTVFGSDIVDGQVRSVDIGTNQVRDIDVRDDKLLGGGLTGADTYGLTGRDIAGESLTGAEIADQSGVDTCTHVSVRFGELCVVIANVRQNWSDALGFCAHRGLRLPSFSEAVTLATRYDLPDIGDLSSFGLRKLGSIRRRYRGSRSRSGTSSVTMAVGTAAITKTTTSKPSA
jgi:hypothetical protein